MQEQRSLCLCLSNTSAGGGQLQQVQSACHIIAKWGQIAHFTFDSCIPNAQFRDGTWKESIVISKRVGKCKEKFSAVFCRFSPNQSTESYRDRGEDQSKNNYLTTLQKTGINNEGKMQELETV